MERWRDLFFGDGPRRRGGGRRKSSATPPPRRQHVDFVSRASQRKGGAATGSGSMRDAPRRLLPPSGKQQLRSFCFFFARSKQEGGAPARASRRERGRESEDGGWLHARATPLPTPCSICVRTTREEGVRLDSLCYASWFGRSKAGGRAPRRAEGARARGALPLLLHRRSSFRAASPLPGTPPHTRFFSTRSVRPRTASTRARLARLNAPPSPSPLHRNVTSKKSTVGGEAPAHAPLPPRGGIPLDAQHYYL